jgi:Zn ribbon nucleic-acid-binding protein
VGRIGRGRCHRRQRVSALSPILCGLLLVLRSRAGRHCRPAIKRRKVMKHPRCPRCRLMLSVIRHERHDTAECSECGYSESAVQVSDVLTVRTAEPFDAKAFFEHMRSLVDSAPDFQPNYNPTNHHANSSDRKKTIPRHV